MILFYMTAAFASSFQNLDICQNQLVECEKIYQTQPQPTRNPNIYRFSDPQLKDAKWLPLHELRLNDPNSDLDTQLALIHLISSTSGDWESILLPLVQHEHVEIRSAIAQTTKWSSVEFQSAIINALQHDTSWEVRSELIRAIGYNQPKMHQDILIAALQDDMGRVRYDAIRVIGWNYLPVDMELLRPLLKDIDPMVRLHTLRAISRIYPNEVLSLAELNILNQDESPMVRSEVQRLQAAAK